MDNELPAQQPPAASPESSAAAPAPSATPRAEVPDFIHCAFCGEIIRIEAKKCRFCGELLDSTLVEAVLRQQYHSSAAAGFGYREPLPQAQAAMIVGIISIPLGFGGIGIIPAAIAIWLGLAAQRLNRREPMRYEGAGAAMAGVICGAIGSVISLGVLLYAIEMSGG